MLNPEKTTLFFKKIRIIFHHNLGIKFLQALKEQAKQKLNRLLFYMEFNEKKENALLTTI